MNATLKLLLAKARAVAASAITILTGVAVLVALVAPTVASWFAEGTAAKVIEAAATIATWIGVAIAILRNTIAALPSERSVLVRDRDEM